MNTVGTIHRYILIPVALLFGLLLFVGGPDAASLRSFRYIWGMGHVFCFALWSYFYLRWKPEQSFVRQLISVVVLVFLVGGSVELIQGQIGREASWVDLGNDVIGGLAAVIFFSAARKSLPFWGLKWLQALVVLLVVWSAWLFRVYRSTRQVTQNVEEITGILLNRVARPLSVVPTVMEVVRGVVELVQEYRNKDRTSDDDEIAG